MNRQIIVSVGREYGSGGHEIAKLLSEKLDVPLYDRNLLDEIAVANNSDSNLLAKYDEVPKKSFFNRTVRGYSNSPAVNVADLQFALLKSKAADDDSFVIVGRCSDDLFKNYDGFISVFICADRKDRIERIMSLYKLSEKDAVKKIERHDKNRKAYHDYFCKDKWGEAKTYDLCINSSRLGIEGSAEFILEFIKKTLNEK